MTPSLILAVATETGIEFRAWSEPEPTPWTKEEHDPWLTYYQTFRAADKEEEEKILAVIAIGSAIVWYGKLRQGIDVTSIVEIRTSGNKDDLIGTKYVYLKVPDLVSSGFVPGESQESILIDLMLMADQYNGNEKILSKFIIKRR